MVASPTSVVYFIRHGTSEWNLLKKWQGQTDTLLAPEGELQAQAAGKVLRGGGVQFERVVCSDLKRAARTAALLTAACGAVHDGRQIAPIVEPRLRECSLGVFEGLHKDEIFGPRFASLFRRLAQLPHETRIRTAYFEGLETPLEISTRALEAATDAIAAVPRGATVACVTHSVILESLCAAAFHKDFEGVHTQVCMCRGRDMRMHIRRSKRMHMRRDNGACAWACAWAWAGAGAGAWAWVFYLHVDVHVDMRTTAVHVRT